VLPTDPIEAIRTPHKVDRLLVAPSYRRGEADSHSVDTPHLFWYEGRYRMLHNCFDGVGYRTGLASSDDLLAWDREGIVTERGEPGSDTELNAAVTSVLRETALLGRGDATPVDGRLLGTWHGHARELAAFSDDLLSWRKADEILIDVGPPGSIDDQYAHKPGVIARDGVLYHFYGASRRKTQADVDEVNAKDRRGIAVATSRPVK